MDSFVKKGDRVMIIIEPTIKDKDVDDFVSEVNRITESAIRTSVVTLDNFQKGAYKQSSINIVISFVTNDKWVHEVLRVLKPGGSLVLYEPIDLVDEDAVAIKFANRISNLRLGGFNVTTVTSKNISSSNLKLDGIFGQPSNGVCEIIATKPDFEIGSSIALNFARPVAKVWKLDDAMNDDIIDEDDLLNNDDDVKPEATSLKVCGTTGKRKACKDCSCGLKEELNDVASSQKTVTSSCGSCYLGDAFRCASCPYLGMPAFKPGEKIVLSESQLSTEN